MIVPENTIYARVELETIFNPVDNDIIEIRLSEAERRSNSRFFSTPKAYDKYYWDGDIVDENDCHSILKDDRDCVDIFSQLMGIIARRYAIKTNADIDIENISDKDAIAWLEKSQNLPEGMIEDVKQSFLENINDDAYVIETTDYIKTTWQIIYYNKTFSIHKIQKLIVFDKDEIDPTIL